MNIASYLAALKVFQLSIYNGLSIENGESKERAFKVNFDDNDNSLKSAIRAIKLLRWSDNSEIQSLRILFDQISLTRKSETKIYWDTHKISNKNLSVPYSLTEKPESSKIESYLNELRQEILPILRSEDNWNNLSLLTLISEKYGSFISLGDENVAFVDLVRSTASVAAALAEDPKANKLRLIVGDLSGIQRFIYTISAAGALKSLRARSFYLELVTEEIVQQLLEVLKLPRTNIIFSSASKFYILAANSNKTIKFAEEIGQKINQWLQQEFQGKVFLAIDSYDFDIEKVSTQEFVNIWSKANKKLDPKRSQKLKHQINDLLKPQDTHEPCEVCHRDDVENLKKLDEDSEVLACGICRRLYRLGSELREIKAIVRSKKPDLSKKFIRFKLTTKETYYYHLFYDIKTARKQEKHGKLHLINNWNLDDYSSSNANLLLIGKNYYKRSSDNSDTFTTAEELAEASQGIKRVGYLRMDVDNLGRIFAEGLGEKQTLPQIAGLSRQMTYFFKVYLNSLAEDRDKLPQDNKCIKVEISDNKKRDNLLFIYAGGDDLFISGAWNEVVEFSFDVYQSFRAYTGYNPDITISAGISLAVPKYPLYQAAEDSGYAENASKDNGRDSLSLFGETFKWDEWLGSKNLSIDTVEAKDKKYWDIVTPKPKQPKLLGVFPIVNKLNSLEISKDYSHNFVRNLVNVSNLQRQKLKEIAEERKTRDYEYEDKDIKYYLHLPQIAYTLDRLPKKVLDDEDFRKALKNPYNAPYYRAIATWIELLNR